MKPTSKFFLWSLMLASTAARPLAAQETNLTPAPQPSQSSNGARGRDGADGESAQGARGKDGKDGRNGENGGGAKGAAGGDARPGKSSATAPIERQALLAQINAAHHAIGEAAQSADEETGADAEPFRKTMEKYSAWLGTLQGEFTALGAVPANQGEETKEVAEALNGTAWELLTESNEPAKNAAVALKVTDAMIALAKAGGGTIPAHMLDTRARALFLTGARDAAMRQQQEAVTAADSSEKELLKATLAAYRQGELPAAAGHTHVAAEADAREEAIAESRQAEAEAARAEAAHLKARVEAMKGEASTARAQALETETPMAIPPRASSLQTLEGGQFDTAGVAVSLNEIAWELLTHPDTNERKPDLALSLSEVAETLATEGQPARKDAALMDTRARALFQLGRKDEAIALQKEALEAAYEEDALKEELATTLAAYEKGESPAAREEDESPAPAEAKATQLNSVAWVLAGRSWKPEETLKIADAALALAGDKEVRKHALDTRARAAFQAGRKEDAIATEKQAIAACGAADGTLKQLFEKTLESYKQGKLPPADHPIGIAVEGKPGIILSPFTRKMIDARDLPAGTLIVDPTTPESPKRYFRVPAAPAEPGRGESR